MTQLRTRPAAALLMLAATACGGDDGPRGSATPSAEIPAESATVAREPLTDADLVGLSLADLSIELPWTENRVSRDPGPAAARAEVQEAAVSAHEGFDRVLFRFTDTTPFPGYRIEILDASTPLTCGEGETDLDLGAERTLVVHLQPARREGEGLGLAASSSAAPGTRFGQFGPRCLTGDGVVWAAGLSDGSQVRVLELRGPQRLVVDVR